MESFLEDLVPIVAIIFVFGAPALLIIVLATLRHRQRMEMIRQGVNPDAQTLVYPGKKSLLWGLLLTCIGLAAFISSLLGGDHELGALGLFLAGAGIALLIYWKLTEPDRERMRRLYEEKYMTPPAPKNPPASGPEDADFPR